MLKFKKITKKLNVQSFVQVRMVSNLQTLKYSTITLTKIGKLVFECNNFLPENCRFKKIFVKFTNHKLKRICHI